MMQGTKICAPEYLSKDILDPDFVKTFMLSYRLQFILGSSRVEFKDQFVTAPTRSQKCYTIFCIVISLFFNLAALDNYVNSIQDPTLHNLTIVSIWIGFTTYLFTIINARFVNGQSNADFFVRLQKIDRLMAIDRIKQVNETLQFINNISIYVVLVACILFFIGACFRQNIVYLAFFGALYSHVTEIVEVIWCSNLIVYFIIRLRFINCVTRNHLTIKKTLKKPKIYNLFSNRKWQKLALESHSFSTYDCNVYLKELFEGLTMFQMLYRFQLLGFCIKLVTGTVLVFCVILFSIQRNAVDIMQTSSLIIFTFVDILISTILGFRLQMFFGEVKETKRLSIAIMAAYSSGPLREKARKMLKMIDENPPKLSIYDMYNMDASIFLSLFSLITSLIVTLLQFAFL